MDYSLLHKKLQPSFDLLIPFLKFNKELEAELLLNGKKILFQNDKFMACEKLDQQPIWAQDWWPDTKAMPYVTKFDALKILKAQKNLGVYYNTTSAAIATNLRKELRELNVKRIDYSVPAKFNFKYFGWTVLDKTHLLVCENPHSRFPLGWHEFNEDKNLPPNRAYLKLWEILCLGHIKLNSNDVVLDLGSSPGGWSWALSEQVKKVYSVDKAPLSPPIAKIKSIVYTEDDAFKLKVTDFADCNWLFSDIICTPERLLSLVNYWLKESPIQNFVCTIKFKGPCDFDMIREFLKIEGSKIIHLYQNKNEVTWIRQRSS